MRVDRRELIRTVLAAGATLPFSAFAQPRSADVPYPRADARSVWLVGDEPPRTASDVATRLASLTAAQANPADGYLAGGAIEALEARFAELLGKEDCAFFPTGTLANTVAVRVLCGERSRAICQADSHVYRDESDAVQRLAGINLVPLGQGSVAPTLAELSATFDAAENGPYPLKIGAISLESPVRRLDGEMIDPAKLDAIAALAREHGARIHLDGARLLLAPPSVGLKSYVARCDTVYVSLYKYLGAPFGAVLAGSRGDIAAARDWRHIQGGLIHQGWQAALLASDGLSTFPRDIARAHAVASALVETLERRGVARLRRTGLASNIMMLEVAEERARIAAERGRASGIRIARWHDGTVPLYVNTSILRRPVSEYLGLFGQSEAPTQR